MTTKYKVEGLVTVRIEADFTDDGDTDLEEQARDALQQESGASAWEVEDIEIEECTPPLPKKKA